MPRHFLLIGLLTAVGAAHPTQAQQREGENMILFLHHSTGGVIWQGGLAQQLALHHPEYRIVEQNFPKSEPYGWKNYPYDYWKIWVDQAGDAPFQEEPTLEMLTPQYDTIIFKHCYPVSNIQADSGNPDVGSEAKSLENYYLQYAALKEKLRQFPQNRFILWTGAALNEKSTTEENARRARTFFTWVKEEWDEPGDNIFIWDFYELETEGGLYLKPEYAAGPGDSHPSGEFAERVAPLFARRIVDVIEGRGDSASRTGDETAVTSRSWGALKEEAH